MDLQREPQLKRRPRPRGVNKRFGVPQHVNPLVAHLFKVMWVEKTTQREVAERVGISQGSLSHWKDRNDPSLSNFQAALNAIGLDLKIVEKKDG